jgi:hypothetical protein
MFQIFFSPRPICLSLSLSVHGPQLGAMLGALHHPCVIAHCSASVLTGAANLFFMSTTNVFIRMFIYSFV